MEEGEEPEAGGNSLSGKPFRAPEEGSCGEAPGSAKACLRHQEASEEGSPDQKHGDGGLPSRESGMFLWIIDWKVFEIPV